MESRSIAIFDSGVGGLTVMRQIIDLLPQENIIYFGDTARLPYGNKGRETIIRYALESATFLMSKQIKCLVVACNSAASALNVKHLQSVFNLPVIGVIDPGVEAACNTTSNQCIGVLGTRRTIASEVYQKGIKGKLPLATIYPIACPLFVPLVEELLFNHAITVQIAKEYLTPLIDKNIDTLVLGCTHYPLLRDLLQEIIGDNVVLVDSALTCAAHVKEALQKNDLLNPSTAPGEHHYYVTDDPDKFKYLGQELLGLPIEKIERH